MESRVPQVLIVEDDDAHAELIRRVFAEHDRPIELTRVASLEQAQARLRTSVPDLVITDLRLPDGDGGELIFTRREDATYPVVVMTSFGDQQIAVEAMRRGALDYVVKSETTLLQMPRLAERALREWDHVVERRRAEEALRRSEEHFRSLIENATDLIALLETGGRVRYVSPSVTRALGWEPPEAVGRPLLDFAHPEDQEAVERAITTAKETPGLPRFTRVRLRTRGGEWRCFDSIIRGQPPGSAEAGIVVNARDVTEQLRADEARRQLEAQLRQAQKLETLGTLAGGIAHDFNNLLQAVMGCTELAQGVAAKDSPVLRYLDRSLEVTRRARDLVQQILQFARRAEGRRERLPLRPVVEEVVRLLRATTPATVEIRERFGETGTIEGDPSQVHQVLMNLATNALQAMGRGGVLEIAVDRLGPDVSPGAWPAALPAGTYQVISVHDTGPGVPPEIQDRIFEPFYTTKEIGTGTGLGLSVAHGIVKGHGGAITCESAPGQGTTFRIYLPEASRTSAAPPETAGAVASGRGRLLFVDDDEDVVFVGRGVLEALGHAVVTASDGLEALEIFRHQPGAFDVAVVDEMMPRMSGSQLAMELRRLRPGFPIVIASGHGPPAGALLGEDHALLYLPKPFEARQLAEVVGLALERAAGGSR